MKIYSLIQSVNQYGTPSLTTEYFLESDLGLAKDKFQQLVESVGDDYETIYLESFDTDTKVVEHIKSWEGNDEDLEEEDEDS